MNERQEAIIKLAEKSTDKFQTADVLAAIQGEFEIDRITVIRDLTHLVSRQLLIRSGKGRNVAYELHPARHVFAPAEVEEYFKIPQDSRKIKQRFDFEIYDHLKSAVFTGEELEMLQGLHEDFLKHVTAYTSQTLINKEYERILIEFSWKSSQIEGNTYSLLSTERLIKENTPDASRTSEETQMILNHKDAFNEALQNKDAFAELSVQGIEFTHSTLTKELGISRNIRSAPVGITGTAYKPLDNEHQIREALEKLVELVNGKPNFFEKSFISLLLLSYIQAFEDSNKRTARMVSNAILIAHGSIPMSYRAVNEVEYKEASLLFYETNNLSYFKEIYIKQYKFAVNNYFV